MVDDRPDERYWADYLRISLPAAALLLLLGLFWYWAAALIGGGQAAPPPTAAPPPSPTATMAPSPTPPVTPTPESDGTGAGVAPTPTAPPAPPPDTSAETPVPATSCSNAFDVGSNVTTVEASVRLRAEPSTDAEVVQDLDPQTQLRISGPAQEADGCWWPVTDPATDDEGFVREDTLQTP